jgi:hypothetical protein
VCVCVIFGTTLFLQAESYRKVAPESKPFVKHVRDDADQHISTLLTTFTLKE